MLYEQCGEVDEIVENASIVRMGKDTFFINYYNPTYPEYTFAMIVKITEMGKYTDNHYFHFEIIWDAEDETGEFDIAV
jgi:hypothetical protein